MSRWRAKAAAVRRLGGVERAKTVLGGKGGGLVLMVLSEFMAYCRVHVKCDFSGD